MKRTFTTAITFLVIILVALLVIGPKRIDSPSMIIIEADSTDGTGNQNSFTHECRCINKNKQEIKAYKYYAGSEYDADSMCHTQVCAEMFGAGFMAFESKVLNTNN